MHNMQDQINFILKHIEEGFMIFDLQSHQKIIIYYGQF